MNGFFQQVYDLVAQIPPGRVATYGQIARMLEQPHNARVVGWAMRQAPAERQLPCHRVVKKNREKSPLMMCLVERGSSEKDLKKREFVLMKREELI